MYGALELPMIWLYAWFSIITTTVWSGVGTPPAAFAVPPIPAHRPIAPAARPRAEATAATVRRVLFPAGITWTSGGWRGAVPRQSVRAVRGPEKRRSVKRLKTFDDKSVRFAATGPTASP